MDTEDDYKFAMLYLWPLSLILIFMAGAEVSRMVHEMDKEIIQLNQNAQLQNCQKLIAGETYGH
jgi:hypothetical protein